MRKIKNPWTGKENYDCFGCCPDNPIGLHMDFYEDGDDIVSFWKPQEHYQGWIGVMHGGILATLADEICGWVVMRKLQTGGMTARLDLKYHKSLFTNETEITIRAHITSQKRNLVFMTASIINGKGETCVEAESVYSVFDREHAKEMGFEHCDAEDDQLLSL